MAIKIIKYKAKDGEEFLTKEEAISYENSIVDKNERKIRIGDWLKESWYFHGFRGDSFPFEMKEYRGKNKSFRFVKYNYSLRLNEDRINNQGWPVSKYEVEIITEKEMKKLKDNPKYVYTGDLKYEREPYYYRVKLGWEDEEIKKNKNMDFETYWKEFGKYEQEIVDNPKLESQFESFASRMYKNLNLDRDYRKGHDEGYDEGYTNGKNNKN